MNAMGSILDSVLFEYDAVSTAPKIQDISDAEFQVEIEKQYKALDSFGNVWLVQNPATWKMTDKKDGVFFYRRKPIMVMRASEFRSQSRGGRVRQQHDDFKTSGYEGGF